MLQALCHIRAAAIALVALLMASGRAIADFDPPVPLHSPSDITDRRAGTCELFQEPIGGSSPCSDVGKQFWVVKDDDGGLVFEFKRAAGPCPTCVFTHGNSKMLTTFIVAGPPDANGLSLVTEVWQYDDVSGAYPQPAHGNCVIADSKVGCEYRIDGHESRSKQGVIAYQDVTPPMETGPPVKKRVATMAITEEDAAWAAACEVFRTPASSTGATTCPDAYANFWIKARADGSASIKFLWEYDAISLSGDPTTPIRTITFNTVLHQVLGIHPVNSVEDSSFHESKWSDGSGPPRRTPAHGDCNITSSGKIHCDVMSGNSDDPRNHYVIVFRILGQLGL